MIISLFFLVLFGALAVREFKNEEIGAGILAIIMGILSLSLTSLIAIGAGDILSESEYNFYNDNERQIVALQDNAFVYRRLDKSLVFIYAYKEGDGIRAASVKADNSVIIYDNSEAKMITQKGNFKNWWHYLYALPSKTKYVFCVPVGTVKEEYRIDLQ